MTVLLPGFKTMLSCSWRFKPHFRKQRQSPQLPCSLLLLLLLQAIINWEVSVVGILCFSRQSPSKTAWHLSVSPTLPFSTLFPQDNSGDDPCCHLRSPGWRMRLLFLSVEESLCGWIFCSRVICLQPTWILCSHVMCLHPTQQCLYHGMLIAWMPGVRLGLVRQWQQ